MRIPKGSGIGRMCYVKMTNAGFDSSDGDGNATNCRPLTTLDSGRQGINMARLR